MGAVHGDYRFQDYKFQEDLKIFSYELFHYLLARRYWHKEYPEIIRVTGDSEFFEEFGKAVCVTWYGRVKRHATMLEEDYPRYGATTDNFKRYVMIKVKDMINEDYFTQTQQIILVTAFLFDMYAHCYSKGYDVFLPYFVEFWAELFLSLFYKEFNKKNGWQIMREECLKLSKRYDEAKAEKPTNDFTVVEIKAKYFQRDINEHFLDENYWHPKSVSRFHTVSKTCRKILPPGHPFKIRGRQETLNIICKSSTQEEFEKLYFSRPAVVRRSKARRILDAAMNAMPYVEIMMHPEKRHKKGKEKKK